MFVTKKEFERVICGIQESMKYKEKRAVDKAVTEIQHTELTLIYEKMNQLNERVKELEERK